jgi:HSP20 family molecular chaperone IbpA
VLVIEVPGVGREDVAIELKEDVLRVEWKIECSKRAGPQRLVAASRAPYETGSN